MSTEYQQTPLTDELDAFFAPYTAANRAKALIDGVGPAGLLHSAGFGSADDKGPVLDLDTVFPIASMTKRFTACAELLARDRGLDVTWAIPGERGESISRVHLRPAPIQEFEVEAVRPHQPSRGSGLRCRRLVLAWRPCRSSPLPPCG